jgi:TRAP-type C4-dicarboxylate transport system permease small subunit
VIDRRAMDRVEAAYGRLLEAFALAGCAVLLALMVMISADVLLRNVPLVPGVDGLPWANEISEGMLYLLTMLVAPWLLRQGAHVRVDILLRAIPARAAWYCEWLADSIALACCVVMVVYGARSAAASFSSGSLSIKTLIMPEWWLLAPLPVAFALLGVEVLFRMRRLHLGARGARDDAVSTA